jgi:hypothetical protein
MTTIELERDTESVSDTQALWSVLIDTNCGYGEPDWEENSEPKPLSAALDEAAELRRAEWITKLVPA